MLTLELIAHESVKSGSISPSINTYIDLSTSVHQSRKNVRPQIEGKLQISFLLILSSEKNISAHSLLFRGQHCIISWARNDNVVVSNTTSR